MVVHDVGLDVVTLPRVHIGLQSAKDVGFANNSAWLL